MTLEPGQPVRTLLELVADDATILPPGTTGHVVGYQGDRLVVSVEDRDTGTSRTVVVNPWEVRRSAPPPPARIGGAACLTW